MGTEKVIFAVVLCGGATGSHVTEVCSAHAQKCIPTLLFLVVVQNVSLRMTNRATRSDRRSRDPFRVSLGVRMYVSLLYTKLSKLYK